MKKSSALALAIAGTLAAPAVLAEVYVSARLGALMETYDDSNAIGDPVDHNDGTVSTVTGAAKETLTFGNMSSRIGWKGETDLGNGMTAFGKLEVGNLSAEARQTVTQISLAFPAQARAEVANFGGFVCIDIARVHVDTGACR
jgi:predicted porin